MANEIYNFLKQNNLTQKSEQDFIKEYSNPDKAKELHGFLQQNNLTKKDSAQFYNEYFKPQTIQQPTQTTTNGIGVLKKQLPFKAVTDFNQSIVDKVVPNKNIENNPIVGIDTPMEIKKPKTQTVYRSNTYKEEVPIKTSAYDVANAMSTEQLLSANNDVFKGVVSQANGDTGLDEFNQQSDKNNNIQAFNRENELYNVRVKTLKERASQLERVLGSKYQTPDFMEQVKSQMATVKQKSEQYNAYVQSRSKEVIALQTELEAIVEQGKAGTQPIEVLKPAYDAKKAQLDAIQRDDEQKRSEIEQLQNDFNGKLDDPDFALYSQIYDKINELSGEQQGLISKPEFAEYRKLLDEGDKAQAKKDAMKKAYQSKGILGKAVDIYTGIGMATNPAAYFLDYGEQVDRTFTGAKIADEGDKLLGRTLKALKSIPKMLENINPLGDANKYDYFDAVFDQAIYASKKRDILNPTATDVQRDIIQKYADVDGYRVMLDKNGKPTNDVRDDKFRNINDKTKKEITDKYNENPKAYKTESDFSFSTLTTKATPTILDMGTMMATAMLTGGTTGLVAGAGTAGTVSTATTVGVSAAQMYGDMYESGLNAGLTPQEANDFATLTSIMTGMVTLVNPMEANIVKGTASKSIGKFISNSISKADVQLIRSGEMSIGQYAKRMAKEGVKNTFGENLEELVLEPAVQRATETYYNTKAQKNGQQGFEDLNKPFFDTKQTIETAMITSMTSLLMTPIEVANSVPEQRKIALQNALDNPTQFVAMREKMLQDGDIEKGKYDYEVKAFEEISKQYNAVKPTIKEDLHDDLAELLLKKYTLKNTMSQVNDEVLNKKNQLLLDDINKRLEEVADGTYNKGKEKALSNIANPNTLIEEDKIATYNGAEVTILDDLADGEVVINTNNPEIGDDGIITVEKSALTDVRNKPKDIEQLQITSAVVNINGKEYEGKNHAEAILKAQADGQDISQVDRQAEGLFKLSDGTIINRDQAKQQFGQDRSELIIPQDEASNQANVEYKRIQDEQKNTVTPVEPVNAGQELNNSTGISEVNGNGGEIQQGDGIGETTMPDQTEVPAVEQEVVSPVSKMETTENPALKDVESTSKALEGLDKTLDAISDYDFSEYKFLEDVSKAYHKAKADGSNPELVKAVEDVLNTTTETNQPVSEVTDNTEQQGIEKTVQQGADGTGQGNAETTTTVLSKEQQLKNDKHDRMVGLMREYNSTPTNKKTRKSEIRQSINKLASDLGYTVKGKIGDKIDVLNAKGKVIRKINITSDEVTVTPEVAEKTKELAQGWFEWNGNELDYHIDAAQLGLTWQEIRRAKADIDAGKTESTNINRVANAINEYGNMESLPLVRGFGGNYERIDITGEDLFWAQKVNEGAELLSEYENIEADREQALKEITETDEKEFEQYSDLYAKFVNEDGLINWEEALKYNQDDKTTTDKGGERQGSSNDIGDGENSQQVEKEKRLTKTEQARLDIENIRKEIKDNSADDFNLFAVFDPKREAQRQYNSHVLLVKLVKAYINLGVASINDIATKIGISIKNLRNAFDEATGKKSYTLDDMLDATNHVDLKEIKDAIVEGDKKAINEAYILAQAYLEATDFEYNTEARDEFIEKVRNNPLSKAIFTETQLEKIYDGQVLSSVDKIRIKYKMLIYDIKNNNRLSKQQIQQKQQEMADDIKGLINNNLKSITGKQAEKFINLANKAVTNNSPAYLARIINQIANLADQRTYQKAKTLYEIIKARSKRKGGVQSGKLTGVLQDFATINPLDVSDIAKYVELAEKVKQASNVVKQPTDADSDLVYDEVQAYVKAQQDEINSNAINDTLEDDAMTFFTVLDNKTKAKFGDDKTFDDLNEPQQREVFASITKDDIKKYGLTNEERDMVEAFKEIKTEQKRQDFITATYNKIGELKDLLANSVGVITQSPAEKEITDTLLNVKLDDMTATEMARVLKLINGITQNNDYSGGGAFVAQQKSVEVNSKMNTLKSEISEFRKLTEEISKFRNFQQISVPMAKGKKLGAKLMEASGINNLMRGIAKTKTYSHNLQKAFKAEKFKSSVFEPISQMRQSIYAAVIQTKIGGDINEAEHIARWKSIIEKNIENLRTINKEGYKEQADLLQKALDEVIGDRQQLKDIADNMSKIDSEGKRVVQFFTDNHAEQKPRFRENSLLFHNKEIEEYNSYTKLSITSLTGDTVRDTGEKLMNDARSTGITKKKSKSMIDRANYESLNDNTGLDFNFINKQMKALGDNEYDINTSADITTLANAFNSDNKQLRELLGAENFDLLKGKLQTILGTANYEETTIVDDVINEATKISRVIALGSITQALKQATVLLSTYINSAGTDNLRGVDFKLITGTQREKDNLHKLMAQSEIGARRAESAGGFYDNTSIKKNISDGFAKKTAKYFGRGKDFASDVSMGLLRWADIKAAELSWITFYKKYLRDNNLTFDENNEFKNPNKDAMAYAEIMVQTAQGANTEAGQADLWNMAKGVTQMVFPFMSFTIQGKARLVDNLMNIANGDDRVEALRDTAGYIGEQLAFNTIKLWIGIAVTQQLLPLLLKALELGDDDDDTKGLSKIAKEKIELEKLRKAEQIKSSFINNIVQDLTYGTIPMVDNMATKPAINFLYNHIFKTNTGIIPDYNRSTDFNIISGGTVGVGYNQLLNLKDDINIITDNNAFGDYKSQSQVSVFTYNGKDYTIVHNGRYTRRDMFFNNVKGRMDVSNSSVPADILKAFVENPSDFKLKEELRKTGGSQDGDLQLNLTDEQKTYAKIMLMADLLTFYGINETVFNQINNKVRGEMKKQVIKK